MTQGTGGATRREARVGLTPSGRRRSLPLVRTAGICCTAWGMTRAIRGLLVCLYVFAMALSGAWLPPGGGDGAFLAQPHAPRLPSPRGTTPLLDAAIRQAPSSGRGATIRACGTARVAWTASSESDRPWRAAVRLSIHPPGTRRGWSTRVNRSARIGDVLANV